MATSPNATQITPPRVPIIDERTGAVSREWYRWFYSLYNIVGGGLGVIPVSSGGTGLSTIPTNGQLLIGNGTGYTLNTLAVGSGISVTNGLGTITLANTGVLSNIAGTGISVSGATGNVTIANTGVLSFSGGTTGLTPAAATTGTITLAGTLGIANGGTNGSATPTAYGVAYGDGTAYAFTAAGTAKQVLIANTSAAPTWSTLTSGTSILYGDGSGGFSNVTIGSGISFAAGTLSATGSGGTVTSVSFTGGIITVATATTTPALTVAGTSGGVPYFSSGTTWASSAALAANALVIGGGAGAAPATTTTGTGVVTALGVNTGTAGAFVVNGGALGTPSGGTVTNLTGTASININGTVGATTPAAGTFTSVTNSALTSGRVTFASTGGLLADSANLFWNNSTNRLGIGVASPIRLLDMTAATAVSFLVSSTGTNTVYYGASNTGGGVYFGRENSAGTTFGSSAYASVVWSEGAYPLVFGTNNANRAQIDSVGNMQFKAGAVMPYAPAPTGIAAATTLTNAQIQGQIISTTGTTYTITMPLGTTMETLATWAYTDSGYDFFVINTATGIITMAVNTGVTSLGLLTIAAATSAHFRIRRTAANTFVLYRLS